MTFSDSKPILRAQLISTSNTLDEIKDEFNLDATQEFGDEHYWTDDSDLEALYPSVSEDYLDFLLSYE